MKSKNKRTKNNISKPVYDEDTVKESLIKLASETPEEEAEMLLDMELKQLFDEFIKNNPGKTYDDFLNSMKLKRISLKGGGLSIDVLLDMMKNEYPKEYNRLLNKYKESISIPKEDLLEAFKNLDKDGVPFEQGGLVSNYKKDLRKP